MSEDLRPATVLIRQWRELQIVKSQLQRIGAVPPDASPDQVIEALRRQMPPDLFNQLPRAGNGRGS